MSPTFQVVALSSLDPDGQDNANEPKLSYPDALKTAQELKSQGKAFRVFFEGDASQEQTQSFTELGAVNKVDVSSNTRRSFKSPKSFSLPPTSLDRRPWVKDGPPCINCRL